jgi:hypothetical protein
MDDGAGTGDGSVSKRHTSRDEAIVQAGVQLLRQAIAPYGVLDRPTLEQVARADSWPEGGFEAALSAAVDAGVITPLPLGSYEDSGRSHPTAEVADGPTVTEGQRRPPSSRDGRDAGVGRGR